MDNQDFVRRAKILLVQHYGQSLGDLRVAWLTKAGANNKCTICSLVSGEYFEITYVGDDGVMVVDEYQLFNHREYGLTETIQD